VDLSGKTILITGATGALGSAAAKACAAAGANLALTARSSEALTALAYALALPAERLLVHPADLTAQPDVNALTAAIAAHCGGADILLHTTGGWAGGTRLAELSDDAWVTMLDLNLLAAMRINRAVLPRMLERKWGRIVNVAARAAVLPGARQAAYNVAKAGVVALTASIAQDYRRSGVTANCVLPGTIDTPDNRRSMPDGDFARWVKPAEIVSAMLYLCSEEAGAVNGAAVPVYGQS
jgi:NAD(P)-dependent dehydrogenase (short-subunit alcohol dehydrogenase family)